MRRRFAIPPSLSQPAPHPPLHRHKHRQATDCYQQSVGGRQLLVRSRLRPPSAFNLPPPSPLAAQHTSTRHSTLSLPPSFAPPLQQTDQDPIYQSLAAAICSHGKRNDTTNPQQHHHHPYYQALRRFQLPEHRRPLQALPEMQATTPRGGLLYLQYGLICRCLAGTQQATAQGCKAGQQACCPCCCCGEKSMSPISTLGDITHRRCFEGDGGQEEGHRA